MYDKLKELEQVKAEYVEKMKKVALIEAGFSIDEAGDYVKFIKADDEEEIERQAMDLIADVKQHVTTSKKPNNNVWKPF